MQRAGIIISHESAKSFWLSVQSDVLTLETLQLDAAMERCTFSQHEIAQCVASARNTLPLGEGPAHLLVPDASCRRHSPFFVSHVHKNPSPPNSFVKTTGNVMIVSAELNYLQMASKLSKAQLSEYATNLCASFCADKATKTLHQRNNQLTTITSLQKYLVGLERYSGLAKAQRCLAWAAEGSASPMETKLFLLLCLAQNEGGYGLPRATLNYRINPGRGRTLSNQNWYVADLCWPDKRVIVEYDGASYHTDLNSDKRRVNALESLGWSVFCASKHEMFDLQALNLFAKQVAQSLGKRMRHTPSWPDKQTNLVKELRLHRR